MTANCLCSAPRGEHYLNCPANTFPTAAEPDAGDVEALTEALAYARTYWQHGQEPRTQQALIILAAAATDCLAAVRREAEVKALTEAAERWESVCTRGHPLDAEVADRIVPWLRDRAARLGGA